MPIRRLLITDTAAADVQAGEIVVWVGWDAPPSAFDRMGRLVHARTHVDAATFAAGEPALVRLALRQPVGFLTALASARAGPEAQAA